MPAPLYAASPSKLIAHLDCPRRYRLQDLANDAGHGQAQCAGRACRRVGTGQGRRAGIGVTCRIGTCLPALVAIGAIGPVGLHATGRVSDDAALVAQANSSPLRYPV